MAGTRQSIKAFQTIRGFHTNNVAAGVAARELPVGFLQFFTPLHRKFAARHRALVQARRAALEQSLHGNKPTYLLPSAAAREDWHIGVAGWGGALRTHVHWRAAR